MSNGNAARIAASRNRFIAGGIIAELCFIRIRKLQRLARGAHEIAEDGYVRTVGADATSVDREAKALGEIEIDTGVIQFGQTEALRGQHAVNARRIDRPRRAVTLPRPARQFVKL